MKEITVGYMGLSKARWKTPKICGLLEQALASLKTLPVKIISSPALTTTESEAIELSEKFIRGNPLRIKFDGDIKSLINTIMKDGFEHHYSVVHADIQHELLAFCEVMNIKPITVE